MELGDIGIVGIVYVISCIIGMAGCYWVLGNTLRFKFTLVLIFLAGFMFFNVLEQRA